MESTVDTVKNILTRNTKVLYGIFGIISTTNYFPPREFLNEFLMEGVDPCDQDARMDKWTPLELSADEYESIKKWWSTLYPNSKEEFLQSSNWSDWVQVIIEL